MIYIKCSTKFCRVNSIESIFGDKGRHARSAVRKYALPSNIAVEVEVIVQIE